MFLPGRNADADALHDAIRTEVEELRRTGQQGMEELRRAVDGFRIERSAVRLTSVRHGYDQRVLLPKQRFYVRQYFTKADKRNVDQHNV